ncbi:MAG TPA: protease HtpX [Burkholderiales bacterium]|nr:protease HtpX [Burkholderiales bacterium]
MKRIVLFLVTNLAVIVVLNVVASVLGVNRVLTAQGGLDMTALSVMAAVFGFGGAFISLAISKWMAKMSTGAQVIEVPSNLTERWLVDTVRAHAQKAGIGMPEVAIYDAPEVNAFATGMSRDNALVAVSTGLLNTMSREEAEAVIGHEVTHVANGDMVTLTLIQGVVNTFVIFFAKIIGYFVDRVLLKNDETRGPGIGFYVADIVAQLVLGVLASMIVMWFSRWREFRADAGGARLAGRNNMIAALARLQQVQEGSQLPQQFAAFGINGGGGFARLFMSHPPLEERIAALRAATPRIDTEWGGAH